MNHQQWLDWRLKGIGSSDAPIIMGVSPWKTKYQLWEERVFGKCHTKENSSMRRGKDMEEEARQRFESMMNVSVFPKNVIHPEYDFMRASLDGIDMDHKVMVEIKCPNYDDHSLALQDEIPEKYYPQCQHQLMVTGLPGMYYFSFYGDHGAIVEIGRDDKYIDKMFGEEKGFWGLVTSKMPPEITDKDYMNLGNDERWMDICSRWLDTKKEMDSLEVAEKSLRDEMIKISQGKNTEGCGVRLSKSIRKGSTDYEKYIFDYMNHVRTQYPGIILPEIEFELYRKPSITSWRLTSS